MYRTAQRRALQAAGSARGLALVGLALGLGLAAGAGAQDHSTIYSAEELAADAERLETAARKIFTIGLEPSLTEREKAALANLKFDFIKPAAGDYALEFYAYDEGGKNYVALPILSLKALEDLTTAYAWLYVEQRPLDVLDLYYAMLRREDPSGFPGGRYPQVLPSIGAPPKAWEAPKVDTLSLSLRNEAFAFVIAHEIAHVILGHEDYAEITTEEARATEAEADRFALELLARTDTPPLGAVLMFQAQAYSLAHRGQFDSEKAWLDYLTKRAYHPLTSQRLRAMGRFIELKFSAQGRPKADNWRFIGGQIAIIANILEQQPLQECMAKAGRQATIADLQKDQAARAALLHKICG